MTGIDRQRARAAFSAYVEPYDAARPRIALKVKHTYSVARIGERIAREEGLPAADVDLAWLCCLLHDIGRFEQLRRWDTFRDADSASHPAIGLAVLFGGKDMGPAVAQAAPERAGAPAVSHPGAAREPGSGRIESFLEDRSHDALIRAAVGLHSDLRLPGTLDARARLFCDIVRDADKVDIFRASGYENSPETVMGATREEFLGSWVSEPARRAFLEHRCLARDERETPLDQHLGTVALAYELVLPASRRIAREQGFIYRDLETPFGIAEPFRRAETRAAWAELSAHLRTWLDGPAGDGK